MLAAQCRLGNCQPDDRPRDDRVGDCPLIDDIQRVANQSFYVPCP
jgi:hypothetical protein